MFDSLNFYPLIRSFLFSLNPEKAHNLSLELLNTTHKMAFLNRLMGAKMLDLPSTLMGLPLRNPVGLAAGLDKNGQYIDALGSLGFGFIEVGTVTPKAQSGNAKPRLFRLVQAQALINRMGFNNQGLNVFLKNVQNSHWRSQGGIIGLNIGKNVNTPIESATTDYLIGLRAVYPFADYVTVNISSPNTKNLRSLQGSDELSNLLHALNDERLLLKDQYKRRVPLALKIAPDLEKAQIDAIAEVVTRYTIDGVIATNTTLSRTAVEHLPDSNQCGGLSGPMLHEMSLKVIEHLRHCLGKETAIIGVGGINQGQRAVEKIQAGANAVQLYTGLIYQGPRLVYDCVKHLKKSAKEISTSIPLR